MTKSRTAPEMTRYKPQEARKGSSSNLRACLAAAAATAAIALGSGAAQAQNCEEVLSRTPETSQFVAAMARTGQNVLLRSAGPFTILAPTNDAVSKVSLIIRNDVFGQQPTDDINPVTAPAVVNAHIVDGKIGSADLHGKSSASFRTRNGNELKLVRGEDGRFVLIPEGRGTRAVESHVVRGDIACSNGVIHLVDTVLVK